MGTSSHTSTPPPDGTERPRRSLVLSGGGIRVSYQAGAIRALQEAGIDFVHVDGTSGGALNAAMLLSGLTPEEMCERWRTLPLESFLSLRPLLKQVKRGQVTALGGSEKIRKQVLPHLGIDMERVRNGDGPDATFNVFDYHYKVNRVFERGQMNEDLLIASMSLPGVLPPVEHDGRLYLDSAFVLDANLLEAVRRGADEIWLVWCLGNGRRYLGGMLRLYVQMLEMGANAALNRELEQIADINRSRERPVRVHVIRPERPLPLDPDLFWGKTDHASLIDRGYADAKRYLATRRAEGVTLSVECTMMRDDTPGIAFRETMAGPFALGETDPRRGAEKGRAAGTRLVMHAAIAIPDLAAFRADPEHTGEIIGHIDYPPLGMALPASHGVFKLFAPSGEPGQTYMVYELGFEHQGRSYYLAGKKHVGTGSIFRMWNETTTLYARLHEGSDASGKVVGAGVLSLGVGALFRLLSTLHATNAAGPGERLRTVGGFGRFFAGELWDTYVSRRSR